MTVPTGLRDDLLTYLFCTSPERARIISELVERNPGVGQPLMDLEVGDEPRARFEVELLPRCWS
jgi:hypothetical protein